ncbi:MAG: protein kinase [Syntrophomonas sp.]|nr:protein kinase [Syntrophomonas sp.]
MNGTVLGGRYELIEIIGEGGMSTVYKARDRVLDRIVAVKILKDEFSRDKNFVEKFKTEALSAARISHPNIVNIYDVGQENDIHYIVMELVDGKTLKDMIRSQAPLSIERAVDIAIMVCDGVQHAHEKGIIHRDIKPHNILITEHGMVKVADFGIARAVSSGTITYGNNIVGSVHYFSPEQARGEAINRTTDIYSIGCILYEMLTGKVPFDADSPITIALRHIHDVPPSPRTINNAIPPALEGIIYKAMEKVPANRFSTALDMRNALLNLNKESSEYIGKSSRNKSLAMTSGLEGRDEANVKKRKLRPIGVALIAMAIIGLLFGVVFTMGGNIFGKEIAVPEIVGKNITIAQQELVDLDLVMNVIGYEASDTVEKDAVMSQDPLKGRKVKAKAKINVKISLGSEKVKVPNIVGIDVKAAGDRLAKVGLNLGEQEPRYDETKAEGMVLVQKPDADTMAKPGTSVNVAVSKGKQPNRVTMPDLKGLTQDAASKKLQDNKLVLGDVKRQESTAYFADQVADQDTAAGVLTDEGTKVNITLSTGPGPVSKTKTLEFNLPSDQQYYKVVVRVNDARGSRQVYSILHRAGETVSVGINYSGTGTAEVLLNDILTKTYNL